MECQTIESYNKGGSITFKSKKKFDRLELAISFAKKINSQEHIIHKVVAYKCNLCQHYHIGRNGKELKEKERIKFKKSLL